MKGNPRCDNCRGTGGWWAYGKYHRCACTRPLKAVAAQMRRANARQNTPPLSMAEMLKQGESSTRRADAG